MLASRLASLRAFVLCAAPLLLTACPPVDDPIDPIKLTQARSERARDLAPAVTPADLLALEESEVAFSLDLYRSLGAGPSSAGQNLFFSPFSLYSALAMTYAGARGGTEAAMGQVLHAASLPQASFHAAFDQLDLALASRGQNQAGVGGSGSPFRLRLTNDVWAQKDTSFDAAFLDTLAVHHGAGVDLLDFSGDPAGSLGQINQWVDQQTEGHVSALLPAGAISPQTRLVLTSAVYFNAAWASPFVAASTVDQPFHNLDGTTRPVPMMQKSVSTSYWYGQGEGWQYLALPYAGGEVSFDVILPDAGHFAEIEGQLDPARLQQMRSAMQSVQGQVALPRFSLAGKTFSAREALSSLGMGLAFSAAADFSGTGAGGLFLADVLQQATVKVNESGTEASAASAAVLATKGALLPPLINLLVDRPFVILIRDVQTSTLLFAGRVASPG